MKSKNLKLIIELRHELHQKAELSMHEVETSALITRLNTIEEILWNGNSRMEGSCCSGWIDP